MEVLSQANSCGLNIRSIHVFVIFPRRMHRAAIATPGWFGFVVVLACRLAGCLCRRHRIGRGLENGRLVDVLALQQGVFLQRLFDLLIEFDSRQLQQPNRLLQLRRERQMLGEF